MEFDLALSARRIPLAPPLSKFIPIFFVVAESASLPAGRSPPEGGEGWSRKRLVSP